MEDEVHQFIYDLEASYWYYVGMRKIISAFLTPYRESVKKSKLLDVGCGTGLMLKQLAQEGSVIGLDNSAKALSLGQQKAKNIPLLQAEAANLPFASETFEQLTALDLIEHTSDDVAILQEFRRVLKPNGQLFICVPAFQFLWGNHDIIAHHKRRYTKSSLSLVLQKAGFEILRITYANALLFLPVVMVRVGRKLYGKPLRPKLDYPKLPNPLNNILKWLMYLDAALIHQMNLPCGVSLLCAAQKI